MPLSGPVKLVYFDLRARGELPRLIMHAAGQPFEDSNDKAAHEAFLPFGQVPLLIDGDRKIVQSSTIARYLAKRLGLAGKSEDEEVLCDQFHEGTEDLYNAIWPCCTKYNNGSRERLEKGLAEGGSIFKYLVSACSLFSPVSHTSDG